MRRVPGKEGSPRGGLGGESALGEGVPEEGSSRRRGSSCRRSGVWGKALGGVKSLVTAVCYILPPLGLVLVLQDSLFELLECLRGSLQGGKWFPGGLPLRVTSPLDEVSEAGSSAPLGQDLLHLVDLGPIFLGNLGRRTLFAPGLCS